MTTIVSFHDEDANITTLDVPNEPIIIIDVTTDVDGDGDHHVHTRFRYADQLRNKLIHAEAAAARLRQERDAANIANGNLSTYNAELARLVNEAVNRLEAARAELQLLRPVVTAAREWAAVNETVPLRHLDGAEQRLRAAVYALPQLPGTARSMVDAGLGAEVRDGH